MTEATGEGTAMEAAGAAQAAHDTTEEGRYIPYSGGSMGWFENSGVLKCELGNNYLFYTVMASDRVRATQFARHGDHFNRRGDRKRFKRTTGVTIVLGKNMVRGTTRDISRHGIRLQFLEEVNLKSGDQVQIKLHQDEKSDRIVFESPAQVVWCERVGKIRPIWNVGMTFEELSAELGDRLQPLLRD